MFPAEGFLEITGVVHAKEYLSRELIDAGGAVFGVEGLERERKTRKIKSTPVVRNSDSHIDAYCPLVLKRITKKAGNGYPAGTILIVECTLNTLYTPDEWSTLLDRVRDGLPQHQFREIFVYDAVSGLSHSFYAHR